MEQKNAYYCLVCNRDFIAEGLVICPHCHAVGDDLEEMEEDDI